MELGTSMVKTPEPETETRTRAWIQPPATAPPSSNGVLKRHAPLHPHHPVVVTYKECLKNHAASIGGYALDGCGEFMPSPDSVPADSSSLKCAACGCHRNFHRREHEELPPLLPPPPPAAPSVEYQPHRRYSPPPSGTSSDGSENDSPSPRPISSSYYRSVPHVFLALSHGPSPAACANAASTPMLGSAGGKRFRTKFTQYQKERMLEFSEKIGWKMQKRNDDAINEFCNEIGVERGVFKVWMHNNKNTSGKKDCPPAMAAATNSNGVNHHHHHHGGNGANPHTYHLHGTTTARALVTNGSSSSS